MTEESESRSVTFHWDDGPETSSSDVASPAAEVAKPETKQTPQDTMVQLTAVLTKPCTFTQYVELSKVSKKQAHAREIALVYRSVEGRLLWSEGAGSNPETAMTPLGSCSVMDIVSVALGKQTRPEFSAAASVESDTCFSLTLLDGRSLCLSSTPIDGLVAEEGVPEFGFAGGDTKAALQRAQAVRDAWAWGLMAQCVRHSGKRPALLA